MSWITLLTTSHSWEAEFMQQLLESHDIPSRVLQLGASSCFLAGETALQVIPQHRWTALLLLSPVEEQERSFDESSPNG